MNGPVTITALGDLALYGGVPAAVARSARRPSAPKRAPFSRKATFASPTWRCRSSPTPASDEVNLCGSLAMAGVPRALGLNVLSLANNHSWDGGPEGLATTLAAVRAEGIATVGAGADLHEARRPAILETRNARIGVLAYAEGHKRLYHHVATSDTPGVAPIELPLIVEDVAACASGSTSSSCRCTGRELPAVRHARAARDRARRRRRGCRRDPRPSPHVLQGLERIDRGLVAYSLGDFVCDMTIGNVIRPERVAARRHGAI